MTIESPSSVMCSELAAPAGNELTEQERAFVAAYYGPANRTGTEAARLAGYAGNNAVLAVQAVRLKARPRVAAAMAAAESNLRRCDVPDVRTPAPAPEDAPESNVGEMAPVVAPPAERFEGTKCDAAPVADSSLLLSEPAAAVDPPLLLNAAAKTYRALTHTRAAAKGEMVTAAKLAELGLDADDLVARGALEEIVDVQGKETPAPAGRLAGILARL
jgi:phage terminase small subunit